MKGIQNLRLPAGAHAGEVAFWLRHLRPLVGAKVIAAVPAPFDEGDGIVPDQITPTLILELRGGRRVRLSALRDAEGNGPGFLSIEEEGT